MRSARGALALTLMVSLGAVVPGAQSAAAKGTPPTTYAPPIEKVDRDGNRIEGASFVLRSCTRFDGDPDWTCSTYADTPAIGWTHLLHTDFYSEGGLGTTPDPDRLADHEVTITEVAAPDGYVVSAQPVSITNVCGGWHLGDRNTASCATELFPFDQAAFDAAGDFSTQKAVQIVNDRSAPVLHRTNPLLDKVDEQGSIVQGAVIGGWACSIFDNDVQWQCQDLADYSADPSDSEFLVREIPARMPSGSEVAANHPVTQRFVVWEDSAPVGYGLDPKVYAVDYACGAWRSIEVAGRSLAEVMSATTATCEAPVLPENTLRWVDPRLSTPTPTPSATQGSSAPPGQPPLPNTGSPLVGLFAVGLTLMLMGGALVIRWPRRPRAH